MSYINCSGECDKCTSAECMTLPNRGTPQQARTRTDSRNTVHNPENYNRENDPTYSTWGRPD